jgi:hypothetical protein
MFLGIGIALSQNTSNLIVFSEDGNSFYLILNGVRQNEKPKTNVKVNGLNAANYTAKVIFSDTKLGKLEKKYLMVRDAEDNFSEVTYAIKEKKGKYKLRWRSAMPLQQAPVYVGAPVIYTTVPKPEISTVIITETISTTAGINEGVNMNINGGGVSTGVYIEEAVINTSSPNLNNGVNSDVYVDETIVESSSTTVNGGTVSQTTTTTKQTNGTSDNVGLTMSVGGVSMGVGINVNDVIGTSQTTTTTTTSSSTTYQTGGNVVLESQPQQFIPGYAGLVGCNGAPMSPQSFNQAKSSIKSKTFADSKMALAKQVTSTNCLTSNQAKEITELFNFESDRLDFAKSVYRSVYDLDNFYIINDAFQFESSIEELDQYIKR